MVAAKFFVSLALTFACALAAPTQVLPVKRQSGYTCGNNAFSMSDVSAAVQAGCNLFEQGETVGNNDYPHRFNNREGFDFLVEGPYQEFPILESRIYTGGRPGPDRVVFDENCEIAGVITHTGASGNGFVQCES